MAAKQCIKVAELELSSKEWNYTAMEDQHADENQNTAESKELATPVKGKASDNKKARRPSKLR
eukprot:4384486-Karenia_brevis.AAC.1